MQTLMFNVKHMMRYSALTVPQPTLSEGSFLMMTISTHTNICSSGFGPLKKKGREAEHVAAFMN